MCTREEIKEIIQKEISVVRTDLIEHEGREVSGHRELEERINDRIDHVIVAIRASNPSVEMVKEVLNNQKRIEEKVDTLKIQVTPSIRITSTVGTLRDWVIWIAAPIVAIGAIIGVVAHIRSIK